MSAAQIQPERKSRPDMRGSASCHVYRFSSFVYFTKSTLGMQIVGNDALPACRVALLKLIQCPRFQQSTSHTRGRHCHFEYHERKQCRFRPWEYVRVKDKGDFGRWRQVVQGCKWTKRDGGGGDGTLHEVVVEDGFDGTKTSTRGRDVAREVQERPKLLHSSVPIALGQGEILYDPG